MLFRIWRWLKDRRRGRYSSDFYAAGDVAVTITNDRVWVDVDGVNVFRAYRVEQLQVDDRRTP